MKTARKPRVVLDTNVLISAFGFGGIVGRIWELAEEEAFEVFISPWILFELNRNLAAKAGFSTEEAAEMTRYIGQSVNVVEPKQQVSIISEKESDNRILECALEAKADVLVTGDMKHIKPLGSFEGVRILTPREFMDEYFPAAA